MQFTYTHILYAYCFRVLVIWNVFVVCVIPFLTDMHVHISTVIPIIILVHTKNQHSIL